MTKTFAPPLRPTRGLIALMLFGAVGLGLIAYRFIFGLGAVTNLSDGYPWGFWIGIDVLVGIALAAGGFVIRSGTGPTKRRNHDVRPRKNRNRRRR